MLDIIYNNLSKNLNNSNIYILGSFYYYNIIIICLLTNKYSINNIAIIASNIY